MMNVNISSDRMVKYKNFVKEAVRQSELKKKENTLEAESIYRRLEVARMMLAEKRNR